LPIDALRQVWQGEAEIYDNEKQFYFSRALSITTGAPKNHILVSTKLPSEDAPSGG
jgi:hypothetical protein